MSECVTPTIISGLCGVLIGAIIGHFLALNREKRKEINEVLDRIRGPFEDQSGTPNPLRVVLTDDIYLLRHHLSCRQRKEYDHRICAYKAAASESNLTSNEQRMHQAIYKNPEIVAQTARDVLQILKRR